MIERISGTKFGYMLDDNVTNEEYKTIINELNEQGIKINCILCNKETSKFFRPYLSFIWTGNKGITLNNSIPNNQFYINRKF